eukprot:m51a1_g5383 hypothetical protein (192) ;mRNA; r:13234-14042
MAEAPKSAPAPSADQKPSDGAAFECHICLDTAADPVVTLCGHLFCWPCIYRWLETSTQCPVCKSVVDRSSLVPLYGRGAQRPQAQAQEESVPHRPQGRREEPPEHEPSYQGNHQGYWGGPQGPQISMGFGFLGLPFFGLGFPFMAQAQFGGPQQQQQQPARPVDRATMQQQQLAQILFVVGLLFLFFLFSI